MVLAFLLSVAFNFGTYFFSDKLALKMYNAQPVTREELPRAYDVVERLTAKQGLPMPKSMTFKPGPSAAFTPVTEETTAQTYVARNVNPSQPLDFNVAGTGQLPRDTQATTAGGGGGAGATDASGQPAATGTAASDTRPGGGLGTPLDPEGTNDPWAKYKWWILGGLGLVMAGGAGIMLRGNSQKTAVAPMPVVAAPVALGPNALLSALKEELFAVETDRLQGRLTEPEYAETKAALEVVLRRALVRSEVNGNASNIARHEV
jgi:hypothetical protein